jgi:hypothetical protein
MTETLSGFDCAQCVVGKPAAATSECVTSRKNPNHNEDARATRHRLCPHMQEQHTYTDSNPISDAPGSEYTVSLHVHRTTPDGKTKVVRLELMAVSDVCMLKSLFRRLLESAFPNQLPHYLTSDDYYLFTPKEEFVSLPQDPQSRTQFRLVASVDGWETVIAVRDMGQDVDPERKMMVTMAEFDSDPVTLDDGTTNMVVSVVAYPSVSIGKKFLDDMIQRLSQDHARFHDIFTSTFV